MSETFLVTAKVSIPRMDGDIQVSIPFEAMQDNPRILFLIRQAAAQKAAEVATVEITSVLISD